MTYLTAAVIERPEASKIHEISRNRLRGIENFNQNVLSSKFSCVLYHAGSILQVCNCKQPESVKLHRHTKTSQNFTSNKR
jgi:hypothetical protein